MIGSYLILLYDLNVDEFHSWVTATAFLESCQVGFLSKGVPLPEEECAVMSPHEFRYSSSTTRAILYSCCRPYRLLQVTGINHDCKVPGL